MESVLCGKLDRIQRRATKTIKGAEELTYMGRLKALQICGLVKQRLLQVVGSFWRQECSSEIPGLV